MRHPGRLLLCALLAGLAWSGPGPRGAHGDAASARTMSETYERKDQLVECLEFVATDLATRHARDPDEGPALLMLLVDNTPSMAAEIKALRAALEATWTAGPAGMRIAVRSLRDGTTTDPARFPREVDGALASLAFLPSEDPAVNTHARLRDALKGFAKADGGTRALILITKDAGEDEDQVEKTRDALLDSGVAFYAVAPEAGFERAWVQTFSPRPALQAMGYTERHNPRPRKKVADQLYFGGEVPIGLAPYGWEMNLAQMDFVWVRPPRYPVPSGFGYWNLATLCHVSDGRYFVFDFSAARLSKRQNARRKRMFESSRLAQLAPDLRPRSKVLKDLQRDARAQAIFRIWQHLADEATPVIGTRGVIERRGNSLQWRPAGPVRSQSAPRYWYEEMDHVKDAKAFADERLRKVDAALGWWRSANGKERKLEPGKDPLHDRIEADFQLLGVNLLKVHFHWSEARIALDTIQSLDVTYRRTRIRPLPIQSGLTLPRRRVTLSSPERDAAYATLALAQQRLATRYSGTPWALLMEKGTIFRFEKDVHVIETEPETERRRPDRANGNGSGNGNKNPPPRPSRPAPPPPGPRPGSGSGGPVTGG